MSHILQSRRRRTPTQKEENLVEVVAKHTSKLEAVRKATVDVKSAFLVAERQRRDPVVPLSWKLNAMGRPPALFLFFSHSATSRLRHQRIELTFSHACRA